MSLKTGHSHQNGKSIVWLDYQHFHKHTVTDNFFFNYIVTTNSELQTPPYQTLLKNEKKCTSNFDQSVTVIRNVINVTCDLGDWVWNVMAHAQKPDFVFRQNGWVHLNRSEGRQLSQLLAAEVCVSAVVMLDTPRSEVVWRVLATHSIRQFPIHFPCRASPCAIAFQMDSNMAFNPTMWLPVGHYQLSVNPQHHCEVLMHELLDVLRVTNEDRKQFLIQ